MKKIQKAAALLAAICLLFAAFTGTAEELQVITMTPPMQNRDVMAIAESDFSLDSLELALINGELKAGETARLTIQASGGETPYTYSCRLTQKKADGTYETIPGTEAEGTDGVYQFTIPAVTCFELHVAVADAAGTRIEYVWEDLRPDLTLSAKVSSVVAECAPEGLSDYQKALNLYNWLCENAAYDYTYTWYTAEGVLLHGTGVCDSFASAYILLLNEAGVDCKKVVGSDLRGESHAWVLVKLSGEWYHMDPTWDEASSRRFYFGLNTELITRDHIISGLSTGGSVPETTAIRYNYEMNRADGVFSSPDELGALFEALPDEQTEFAFYYTGRDGNSVIDWCGVHAGEYGVISASMEGSSDAFFLFTGTLGAGEPRPEAGFTITEDGVLLSGFGLVGEVSIPGDIGLTSIAAGAFSGCDRLTAIEIPEGIVSVGANIFEGCGALTKVTLPASVTSIDGDILAGLSAAVHCPNGSYAMRWAMKTGHEYVLPMGSRILATPSDAKEILAEAFAGNVSIRCVVVGTGLKTIGSRAFADCGGLISINLPASVSSIADDAFTGCSSLTVYCEAGSYAQAWCAKNGVRCIVME